MGFNLNLIKSKNISHTLWNHDVSIKTVCTCITYFVNVSKDRFCQPNCHDTLVLPKSKEKHCMGKGFIKTTDHQPPTHQPPTH